MSETAEHFYMRQRRQLLDGIIESFKLDPGWDGHVICGFALVVEFAGPEGARGIATRSSDANGDTDLTPWAARGLVSFALDDGLFDAIGDEDDEDDDDSDDD